MNAVIYELKHATFVKVADLGVLILGKSGSGKSSLALSLIDSAGRGIGLNDLTATLVADDQVSLWREDATAQLYGKPPQTLAGKLEVRGLGIVQVEYVPWYSVNLVVEIKAQDKIERFPDFPRHCLDILGQAIPVISVSGHDATAAARVRAAIGAFLHRDAVENGTIIR